MIKREHSLLSLILWPSLISNLVTLIRFGLELKGFGLGHTPREMTFWLSLWTLMLIFGGYFAYKLRDAERPYRRLMLTLLVYGLSVRVLTALIYAVSGAMHLNTHYAEYGPPGANFGYFLGAFLPQLVMWPIITVIFGSIVGMPLLAYFRSGRSARTAAVS